MQRNFRKDVNFTMVMKSDVETATRNYELDGYTAGIEFLADDTGLKGCNLLPAPTIVQAHSFNAYIQDAQAALEDYFMGLNPVFEVELAVKGTPFQKSVWNATATIPYGETRSYQWIAEKIGNPKAVRAVAQALAANCHLLFVPCHRVIRHNGEIGGFGCGIDWKIKLLRLEGVNVQPGDPISSTTIAISS